MHCSSKQDIPGFTNEWLLSRGFYPKTGVHFWETLLIPFPLISDILHNPRVCSQRCKAAGFDGQPATGNADGFLDGAVVVEEAVYLEIVGLVLGRDHFRWKHHSSVAALEFLLVARFCGKARFHFS
jgi:hypothetical protein